MLRFCCHGISNKKQFLTTIMYKPKEEHGDVY
jgi:hypothetical protein